ncbi:MAG: hypothetical protein RI590_04835 [Microbacteriaceae bacterium]|jgi:hypothetical protein|nr:hypothetical protein [Microbacteriaceae bacterium]MDR9444271.1 hypothetical protein [Microbacteriaceae bacterium]
MRRFQSARVYLGLAAITGVLSGAVIYVLLRDPMAGLIWGGSFFILTVVGLATLDLAIKDDPPQDPNKPKLD